MTQDLTFIQTLDFNFAPHYEIGDRFPRKFFPKILTQAESEHSFHIHDLILQNGKWNQETGALKVPEYLESYDPNTRAFFIEDLKYALQKNRNNMLLQYRRLNCIPLTPQEVDKIIEALKIIEAKVVAETEQDRKQVEESAKKAEEYRQEYNRKMNAERAARMEAWDELWGTDLPINTP